MPANVDIDPKVLAKAAGKTVIVTGAANGIGAATAALFNQHGANVVIADLPFARAAAEALIPTLTHPDRAIFVPVDILQWAQMQDLFKQAVAKFGRVDVVVANAGIMESSPVINMDAVDENGDLLESREAFKVLDVNIKGTLNTVRLAIHTMRQTGGGSVVLLASTSGYFGGTGVAAYIASKHAVIGLLRACQAAAVQHGIRLNGVAPFFTPTHITAGFAEAWKAAGLEANTPDNVAAVVLQAALDEAKTGTCILTCGSIRRELEGSRAALVSEWMGEDVTELMDHPIAVPSFRLKDLGQVLAPDDPAWVQDPQNPDSILALPEYAVQLGCLTLMRQAAYRLDRNYTNLAAFNGNESLVWERTY